MQADPCSQSVILDANRDSIAESRRNDNGTTWSTPGGTLTTNKTAKGEFTLPKLQDNKLIEWKWHVVKDLGTYDAIIGRELMQFLGIDNPEVGKRNHAFRGWRLLYPRSVLCSRTRTTSTGVRKTQVHP